MWNKHRLGKIFFCVVLGLGSLGGMPMRPEEIEELLHCMNQPKIAHTNPDESDQGDDPIEKLRQRGLETDYQ